MLEPNAIRHKGLRRYYADGDPRGLTASWIPRIEEILFALHVATSPQELDLPQFRFHRLKGKRKDSFSLRVTRNWRVTFKWSDAGPYDVDLEDYHG